MLLFSLPSSSASAPRKNSLGTMMLTSTMMLLATIGTLIVILALLILFHQNINATKGYRLRSLESVRNQLLLNQEALNMEISKAQALETLQHDTKIQAMIRVTKPQYIRTESSIAKLIRKGSGE